MAAPRLRQHLGDRGAAATRTGLDQAHRVYAAPGLGADDVAVPLAYAAIATCSSAGTNEGGSDAA